VRSIARQTPEQGAANRTSAPRRTEMQEGLTGRKGRRTNAPRLRTLARFLFHWGVPGIALHGHHRAALAHNGVFGTSARQRHQRRGRHRLSPNSNDESEAGQNNEGFAKGDDPHAESIRATLLSFKAPYRLDALGNAAVLFAALGVSGSGAAGRM
jgi:hypothetical protein